MRGADERVWNAGKELLSGRIIEALVESWTPSLAEIKQSGPLSKLSEALAKERSRDPATASSFLTLGAWYQHSMNIMYISFNQTTILQSAIEEQCF